MRNDLFCGINKTLIDKKVAFNKRFLHDVNKYFKCSKTLTQIIPSTFKTYCKDNKCIPFWNDKIKETSKRIFMPTNTNIIKSKYEKEFNKNKWFNNEFYIEKGIHKDDIECEPIKETNEHTKVAKIKLYLTRIQMETMKRFMGVYRYFYNRTVEYCNNINKETKKSYYNVDHNDETTKIEVQCPKSLYNWMELKKILYENKPKWVEEIKYDSHSCKQAIKEALTNVMTNIKKYQKTKKQFKMKMKSKKDLTNTIIIEKQTISDKNTLFKNYKVDGVNIFDKIKMSENISDYEYCGSTITYHKILKTMMLNLTYTARNSTNKKDELKTKRLRVKLKKKRNKVCSIDPGINNFATVYSDSEVCKLGTDCSNKIYKVCKEIDIIQSRIDSKKYYDGGIEKKMNADRRRNLKKAMHKKIQYIKNLRDELHNQVINYITQKFSKIITSPFETQEMVCKLNSQTARKMNTLSFYKFKTKLKQKCNEMNCELVIKPEYYTSKTCTKCGNIKYNLGGNKIYCCDKCGMIIERDFNGARNIMLRNN